MASAEIELKDVSIRFSDEEILRNINLSVAKGEVLVIIGPSGQGKSVLLKLMAGLLSPTAGEVLICGKNFHTIADGEREQLRRKMGMLFQKNALFDSLSAAENIGFPLLETTQLSEEQIKERAHAQLESVGLGHASQLFPDEISGGMQKRLGIARALAMDPEIIFYDDPTAGLDPITSRKIVDLILRLKLERNSTLVAITNDMNRAFQMGTRIVMVLAGQVIVAGTPQETKSHSDARIRQFIRGELAGPLTEMA